MKIAISTEGDTIESPVDQRFGRCKYFLIVDIEGKEINKVEAIENQGIIQGHGAAFKAAEQIGKLGVEAVITGNLGPNATDVLKQLGIKAYQSSGIAKDSVQNFIDGELQAISAPTAQAHYGMNIQPKTEEKKSGGIQMKIAISTDSGMVSPHFGRCPEFTIAEIRDGRVVHKEIISNPGHMTGYLPKFMSEHGVSCVIAGGAGMRAQQFFAQFGIELITGIQGYVDDVIEQFAKGKLEGGPSMCHPGGGKGYGIDKVDSHHYED